MVELYTMINNWTLYADFIEITKYLPKLEQMIVGGLQPHIDSHIEINRKSLSYFSGVNGTQTHTDYLLCGGVRACC